MKKISKRVREEAAVICSMAASDSATGRDIRIYPGAAEALGWSCFAASLAEDAWLHTRESLSLSESYAEAEAMLRMGWTP